MANKFSDLKGLSTPEMEARRAQLAAAVADPETTLRGTIGHIPSSVTQASTTATPTPGASPTATGPSPTTPGASPTTPGASPTTTGP